MLDCKEVAALTGLSVETLQHWLREAHDMKVRPCPFGEGVRCAGGSWRYLFYAERVLAYLSAADLKPK